MNRLRTLAVCLFVFTSPAAAKDFETPVLITRAKIVTKPGSVIENGSILIHKGRIVAVGPELEAPSDADTFDASGLIIYSGFIDASTHLGITRNEPTDAERARVEDENPDVRQGPQSATIQAYRRLIHPSWRAEELFDPGSTSEPEPAATAAPRGRRGGGGASLSAPRSAGPRESHRSLGFTSALICPKEAIFAGTSAVIQLGDEPLRQSILKSGFAQHAWFTTGIRTGDFFMSAEQLRYPTTTFGAMAAFRQAMLDASWHKNLVAWCDRHPDQRRAPLDRDLEALWRIRGESDGKDPNRPVVFFAHSENEIHRALNMAHEFQIRPIISGGREAWKVADRLRKENVPVILSMKWPEEPKAKEKKGPEASAKKPTTQPARKPAATQSAAARIATTQKPSDTPKRLTNIFDEEWEKGPWESARQFEERQRLWGEFVDNAKCLKDAGVQFAIGTFEMKNAGDVFKNLRQAIDRGLPEDAALAALTTGAAEIIEMSPLLGEIAPGKLANLTLQDKPLSDKKAKVKWLFVEGRRYEVSASAERPGREAGKEEGEETGKDRAEASPARRGSATSAPASAPASQPTSKPTSQATSRPAGYPEFACEIQADRKPAVQTGGNLLLRNATLIPVSNDDLPKTDLLIQNGRIEAIGRGLDAPPGVRTIDLTGYFVSPGIIDPHSHICTDGGLNEFALSVTCEVRVKDVIDHRDVSAYRALAGGVTTIHTMHGSANTIGGQNAVLRLKYGRPASEWIFKEAPETVKFALGENVKQSNTDRRSRGTRFPNSRSGVEAVIRRSLDAAIDYESDRALFEKETVAGRDPMPVRRDLRLDTLLGVHDGKVWVHCHCYRSDEIQRLLAIAEEYGFRIGVLQHILEGYRLIPEIARHGCGASTFSDWWAYKIEAFDAIPHNAARMTRGGVVTTVNSDSAEVMRHLNLEAAKSIRYGGLSPREAMRLCTLNGAMQLGVDEFVGSLEIGKLADIAVFDAHPLDSYSKCVLTMIDGEIYFQHAGLNLDRPPAPAQAARPLPKPREALGISPNDDKAYWILNATIHPVGRPVIPNGTLILIGGEIGAAGPATDRQPPEGVTVVDATGLHIYPGIVNAASTVGLAEIGSVQGSIDTSEIADFQPDLLSLSAYNPFSSMIEVARCEGITTAMIIQAGGIISARAGIAHLDGWSTPEATLADAAALPIRLPSLPAEFPEDMEPNRKQDAIRGHKKRLSEIEDFFNRAKHYAKVTGLAKKGSKEKPPFDRRLEAMIPYVNGEAPVLLRADSYKEIREALRFAEAFKLKPIIYGGRETWKLADELARKKIDVILDRPTTYPAGDYEPWDSSYRTPAVLHQAGVRFCISLNDASLAKLLSVETGLAVAHGLPEDAAIRAITLSPAEILGVADRIGSIEPGKIADLIVTTDSPLQAAGSVVAVFIAGRPVEMWNKHRRMDAQFQARPAPRLAPEPTLRGRPPIRLSAGESGNSTSRPAAGG